MSDQSEKACPMCFSSQPIPDGSNVCVGKYCAWWVSERFYKQGAGAGTVTTTHEGGCALHALAITALHDSIGGWPDDS